MPSTLNIEYRKNTEPLMNIWRADASKELPIKKWVDGHVRHVPNRVEATPEEFIAKLTNQLKNLIKHAFLADEHASFLRATRFNLLPNVFAVQLDFSEKFKFSSQNEIQSAHWNRTSF
jgi:hypothetical protein